MITPGSTPEESPSEGWQATDHHGISSALTLQGSVLELATKANRRSLQWLIDLGATGFFFFQIEWLLPIGCLWEMIAAQQRSISLMDQLYNPVVA